MMRRPEHTSKSNLFLNLAISLDAVLCLELVYASIWEPFLEESPDIR